MDNNITKSEEAEDVVKVMKRNIASYAHGSDKKCKRVGHKRSGTNGRRRYD